MRRIARELDALPAAEARFLAAFAYVLARVARADLEISGEETEEMLKLVREYSTLTEAQALLVVQMAKTQATALAGTENYLVTRQFKEMSNRAQRVDLLRCLFAVAAADNNISVVESTEITQIGQELASRARDRARARRVPRPALRAEGPAGVTARAMLFDFGGTLYDYRCFARAEAESLAQLARWAGHRRAGRAVARAHRDAMKRVFDDYRDRAFYFHSDLFRDAVRAMLASFGRGGRGDALARYRRLQWECHARDFELRPRRARDSGRAARARAAPGHGVEHRRRPARSLARVRRRAARLPRRALERARALVQAGAGDLRAGARAARAARRARRSSSVTRCSTTSAGASALGLRSVLIWHRDDRDPPDGGPKPDHVIRRFDELLEIAR